MVQNNYHQIFIIFLFFFFQIIQVKCQCTLPQYLIEGELICVDRNNYPNYYIDNDILKKCDYPCYECLESSNDDNHNCISCERGYEFDSSTNSCIKCPKNRYKYIYSSNNTCINSNEGFCKKEITKCTLLTDELFIGCPSDLPVLIESKKMCVGINICNYTDFLNGICKISNINYIESRILNPTYFLTNETLKNKHNIGVVIDNYENILFEACGDFDENRYYYGIKTNGNSNFTDEFNNPTYYTNYVDGYSGNLMKKNNFILLDFNSSLGGKYFMSFFPDFNIELESFSLALSEQYKVKTNSLLNLFLQENERKKIENYTISSVINSFVLYKNNPSFQLNNLFLLNVVGVNDLNEYCLIIICSTLFSVNYVFVQLFIETIKSVDNFKRTSLALQNHLK